MLNPDPVPSPGIAGGPNENAIASGTSLPKRWLIVSTMFLANSRSSGRSSQFFRLMKTKALLVADEEDGENGVGTKRVRLGAAAEVEEL